MPVPADLLEALQALYAATPALQAAWPGGLYEEEARSDVATPYAVIEDYVEVEPGESLEDRPVDVLLTIYGTDSDSVAAAGQAAIAVLDPNPARPPLSWANGSETFNIRTSGKPYELPDLGPGGNPVWAYDLAYRFWIQSQVT